VVWELELSRWRGPALSLQEDPKRRDIAYDDQVFPKTPRKLLFVLSPEEITRTIEAAPSLMHRTILMVLDGTGIRQP